MEKMYTCFRGCRFSPPDGGRTYDVMVMRGRALSLRLLQTLSWTEGLSVLIIHTAIFFFNSTPRHFTFSMREGSAFLPNDCKYAFLFVNWKWNDIDPSTTIIISKICIIEWFFILWNKGLTSSLHQRCKAFLLSSHEMIKALTTV